MSEQLHMSLGESKAGRDLFPTAWAGVLPCEALALAEVLLGRVAAAREEGEIYPPAGHVFAALAATPPESTRVVILGQDPYHGPGQAQGLAFSVPEGIRTPPSLRNIFKELDADLALGAQHHSTDLSHWAAQGVLLLNTALTVEAGQAGSHAKLGWHSLTDALIAAISAHHSHLAFVLWGNHAQERRHLIDESRHLVIATAHPSPLSARRGFFGSRPFSQVNAYVSAHGGVRVRW